MSTDNNDKVSIKRIVERAKSIANVGTDRELSEILGISSGDFGNRKKRGTLLPMLIKWATNENVDLNFLVTGKAINSPQLDPDPEIAELMSGARRVLTSGNPIAFDALERNIRYFDHAISTEKELQLLKEDMEFIKTEFFKLKLENQRLNEEEEAPSSNEKAA